MQNVGENIKQARLRQDMTQEQLAAALNTTKSAISRYELGKREPSLALLYEIARVLDVRIEDLMGGIRPFDSSADFDAAWKEATSRNSKPGYEAVTVYHKPGGEVQIIDHRKERLSQIYDQLDSDRQGQLVKYGEFLLNDSEND